MRHAASLREAISRRPSARTRWYALAALLILGGLVLGIASSTGGDGKRRRADDLERHVAGRPASSRGPGSEVGSRSSGNPIAGIPALRGRPVSVSVDVSHPGAAVPTEFLGLSFEAVAIPGIVGYAERGNLARLLHSLGQGILRFGGVSADTVAWSPEGSRRGWATGRISQRDLAGLATLARETGWGVLLTVNLGHYEPAAAAQEAATAHALLGAKLAGIEIGNEPDRFLLKGLRGASWSFAAYAKEFQAYRMAIARAVPGIPILGPDASSGERVLPWLRASATLRPSALTDHYYPLTSCGSTPTVSELLSPVVRQEESSMLRSLGAIQLSSGIPLEIDETNDISCKGQPGVSNTFASALWATDYAARAMTMGFRTLDFHDLISWSGSYSPLVAAGSTLHPNPEWYALLLAESLRGARPLSANAHGAPNLSASAFLGPGGVIQLLLVNFDPTSATPLLVRPEVRVRGRFAGGTILRLTAHSPYATSGVTLGGSEVGASGAWAPRLPLPRVSENGGSLALAMPPSSAALVTLIPG
jgi:hypothetical protein